MQIGHVARSSTTFKPGNCANPRGRPKEYPEVKELARKHTAGNIERLVYWRDQDLDPGASVRAAQYLHEIAWGKPSQAIQHSGPDGGAIQVDATHSLAAILRGSQASK